jgi:hypothetical protein
MFPTDGQQIPGEWWRLFQLLDPDIVYSFVPLQPPLIEQITRLVCPGSIVHRTDLDRERFISRHTVAEHKIGAASNRGLPAVLSSDRDFLRPPTLLNLRDSWRPTLNPDQLFIVLNFGSLPGTVSTDAAFADLPNEVVERIELDTVNVVDLLKLDASKRILSPLTVAAARAPHPLGPLYDAGNTGCHVVVGDSCLDMMYAWNRALLETPHRARSIAWLPSEFAQRNPDDIATWLKNTYRATDQYGLFRLVTYSLAIDQLQELRATLQRITYLPCEACRLESDRLVVPSFAKTSLSASPTEVQQVAVVDGEVLLNYRVPPFLRDGAGGLVMVEAAIQYHPERYAHTNVRPIWRLPRRPPVAHLFFRSTAHTVVVDHSRIVASGLPSAAVASSESTVPVRIPRDRALIWACGQPAAIETPRVMRERRLRFSDFYSSPAGLRFQGTIQLLGSLYGAQMLFEDPYWHRLLLSLAGVEKDAIGERTEFAGRLIRDFFNADPTPLGPNDDRAKELAAFIGRRFVLRSRRPECVTLKQLVRYFGKWRGEEMAAGRSVESWQESASSDEWKGELDDLLRLGVLEQGCLIRCENCGSNNWHPVDRLAAEVVCPGCSADSTLKAEPPWSFRLNALLANGLEREGLLPLLAVLVDLADMSSDMFLFLPPQNVVEGQQNQPFTDLDVMFVRDGKFGIAEVKSDTLGFDSNLDKVIAVAEDMRPDVLILAAPGSEWPSAIMKNFEDAASRLAPYTVVKPWLLSWVYPKRVLEF